MLKGGAERRDPKQSGLPRPGSGEVIRKTLDRVLSRSGFCSRTEAVGLVTAGRVRVNGRVIKDPQVWVVPEKDRIAVDGRPLSESKPLYLVLYKPKGYLTTREDPAGRPTVYDLLPEFESWVFPVGRLDLDTTGLLLFTNDSHFSERLMDPARKVPKYYQVRVAPRLGDEALEALARGIELKDGVTLPAKVGRLRDSGNHTVFEIVIVEGRNRQIRRMVEAVGAKVSKLVRTGIGPLRLGSLQLGQWRHLSPKEVAGLFL